MKLVSNIIILLIILATTKVSLSCSNFQLISTDNTVVIARSMDYWLNLNSHVVIVPRNTFYQSKAPIIPNGYSWQTIYGFVAIQPIGVETLDHIVIDGINEKGLSFGILAMDSKYPKVLPTESKMALEIGLVGAWVLGSFSTVDEVQSNLNNVIIWSPEYLPFNNKLELHIVVHDANGKSLVIEFVNGETFVYDNKLGILTNDPIFPQQLNYLSEYNLQNNILSCVLQDNRGADCNININGFDIVSPSVSRFIKIATILSLIQKPANPIDTINTAFHILNTIDIPIGVSVTNKLGLNHNHYTQWTTVKDLTNKIFYWRSYNDLTNKKIELNKLSFDSTSLTIGIPVDPESQIIIDKTSHFE